MFATRTAAVALANTAQVVSKSTKASTPHVTHATTSHVAQGFSTTAGAASKPSLSLSPSLLTQLKTPTTVAQPQFTQLLSTAATPSSPSSSSSLIVSSASAPRLGDLTSPGHFKFERGQQGLKQIESGQEKGEQHPPLLELSLSKEPTPIPTRRARKRVVVDVYCQLEGYLEHLRPLISPGMLKKFKLAEYPAAMDHFPRISSRRGAILTLYSSTDRWMERLNNNLVEKLNELYTHVCLVLLKPVSDPNGLAYISSKGGFLAVKQLCVSDEGVYDIPYNRSVLEEVLHLLETRDVEEPLGMNF